MNVTPKLLLKYGYQFHFAVHFAMSNLMACRCVCLHTDSITKRQWNQYQLFLNQTFSINEIQKTQPNGAAHYHIRLNTPIHSLYGVTHYHIRHNTPIHVWLHIQKISHYMERPITMPWKSIVHVYFIRLDRIHISLSLSLSFSLSLSSILYIY